MTMEIVWWINTHKFHKTSRVYSQFHRDQTVRESQIRLLYLNYVLRILLFIMYDTYLFPFLFHFVFRDSYIWYIMYVFYDLRISFYKIYINAFKIMHPWSTCIYFHFLFNVFILPDEDLFGRKFVLFSFCLILVGIWKKNKPFYNTYLSFLWDGHNFHDRQNDSFSIPTGKVYSLFPSPQVDRRSDIQLSELVWCSRLYNCTKRK